MNKRTRKLRTMQKALYPKDDTDYKCHEKKEEKDSPALLHQYVNSRITLKRAKKD